MFLCYHIYEYAFSLKLSLGLVVGYLNPSNLNAKCTVTGIMFSRTVHTCTVCTRSCFVQLFSDTPTEQSNCGNYNFIYCTLHLRVDPHSTWVPNINFINFFKVTKLYVF